MSKSRDYTELLSFAGVVGYAFVLIVGTSGVILQISVTAVEVWNGRLSANALLLECIGGWVLVKYVWTHGPSPRLSGDK